MKRHKVINYGKSSDVAPPPAKKPTPASANSSSSSSALASPLKRPSLSTSPLKPKLLTTTAKKTEVTATPSEEKANQSGEILYEVLWTTRSPKMHKTYDNGTMKVLGNRCTVFDSEGTQLASSISYSAEKLADLKEDDDLRIGDKELKVQGRISKVEVAERVQTAKEDLKEGSVKPKVVSKVSMPSRSGPLHSTSSAPVRAPRAALKSLSSRDENRFLLYSGTSADSKSIEVVLEPFLRDVMRPHQLDGVRFLYECVTGQRDHKNGATTGCILADVMGLGKTLQTIALLRTLSTQNPNGSSIPLVKKALVAVPVSLVAPWAKEVTKWLGRERMAPVAISELPKKEAIEILKRFKDTIDQKLLIISYEQVRIHLDLLKNISFGIVVCDEGHRLKNPSSKLSQDLLSLDIPRRVILSGTPFQNNLGEYYALVDFVNPGALDSPESFRAQFERPILASRVRGVVASVRDLGVERSQELVSSTSSFILRRTSKVLEAFLPPKNETVVFCRPTRQQYEAYHTVLTSLGLSENESTEEEDEAIEVNTDDWDGDGKSALAAMTQLSKICNHPVLLLPKDSSHSLSPLQVSIANTLLGDRQDEDLDAATMRSLCSHVSFSGKLLALQKILKTIKSSTKDKVVVVSSFTKTLDLVGAMAEEEGWKSVRLDGSTDVSRRNLAVEQFQRDPNVFLFLLSTKAGGAGLNLFAANRLILFDSSWNPAFDTQAQARVWRDGQTKPTWIYRFLTTGMLDEKIFQRQLVKNEMGRSVLDDATEDAEDSNTSSNAGATSSKGSKNSKDSSSALGVSSFSAEDLKDVFSVNKKTLCDTHDISGCQCTASSKKKSANPTKPAPKLTKDEISDWAHIADPGSFKDDILSKSAGKLISFIFSRSTSPSSGSDN